MAFYYGYTFALLVSVITTFLLARYAWLRRTTNGATMFAWMMFATMNWALFTLVSIFSPSEPFAHFWNAQFRYIFIALLPVAFLGFVLEYSGREQWLRPSRFAWLFVIPILLQILNYLSPHDFIESTTYIQKNGLYFTENSVFGWGFQVHSFYSYILMGLGIVLLIQTAFQVADLYRRQLLIFLIGLLLATLVNLVDILRVFDLPKVDWTVMSFTLTGMIWGWALFRYRLFDMMPVAYEAIFHSMEDAVLVLDSQNRISDLNPSAAKLVGLPSGVLIGLDVHAAFPNQGDLVDQFINLAETQTELKVGNRYYDLKISTLSRQNQRQVGRLVVLHYYDAQASRSRA